MRIEIRKYYRGHVIVLPPPLLAAAVVAAVASQNNNLSESNSLDFFN